MSTPEPGYRRWVIGVEYHGGGFLGWQWQKDGPSIQQALEVALSRVADEPIAVTGAGRTDAGVHATGQVAHFDSRVERSLRSWVLGANANLPQGIAVRWAQPAPDGFHARFSARARSYSYLLLNRETRPALWVDRVGWVHRPLDAERMHRAGQRLLGEHDFSAFRAAECQSKTPVRRLDALSVRRCGDILRVDVTANAFLHHMVRNIVGTLVVVGRGEAPEEWVSAVLVGRDRCRGGATAPAGGLYLLCVDYGERLWQPPVEDPVPPV